MFCLTAEAIDRIVWNVHKRAKNISVLALSLNAKLKDSGCHCYIRWQKTIWERSRFSLHFNYPVVFQRIGPTTLFLIRRRTLASRTGTFESWLSPDSSVLSDICAGSCSCPRRVQQLVKRHFVENWCVRRHFVRQFLQIFVVSRYSVVFGNTWWLRGVHKPCGWGYYCIFSRSPWPTCIDWPFLAGLRTETWATNCWNRCLILSYWNLLVTARHTLNHLLNKTTLLGPRWTKILHKLAGGSLSTHSGCDLSDRCDSLQTYVLVWKPVKYLYIFVLAAFNCVTQFHSWALLIHSGSVMKQLFRENVMRLELTESDS